MPDLERKLELKVKRREKKQKPKMAVHGRRIFQVLKVKRKSVNPTPKVKK